MTTPTEPTPADVHALAAQAEEFADRVEALRYRLRATGEDAWRAGGPLELVAGQARAMAKDLHATGEALQRVVEARGPGRCGIGWGVCPEHGNTLTSTGGTTRCRVARCGRTWLYDRVTAPCGEPVTHRARDEAGTAFEVCNGHALDVEARLVGGTVTRIAPLA